MKDTTKSFAVNRTSMFVLSGFALACWILLFGGRHPSIVFVVISIITVAAALFFGTVISSEIGKKAGASAPRKIRLFQWLLLISWLFLAYSVLASIADHL